VFLKKGVLDKSAKQELIEKGELFEHRVRRIKFIAL